MFGLRVRRVKDGGWCVFAHVRALPYAPAPHPTDTFSLHHIHPSSRCRFATTLHHPPIAADIPTSRFPVRVHRVGVELIEFSTESAILMAAIDGKDAKGYHYIPIQTGAVNATSVEILSGLKEGDEVLEIDFSSKQIFDIAEVANKEAKIQ